MKTLADSIEQIEKVINISSLMRENQLPVSSTRGAALVLDMFCNFYVVKSHKIAKKPPTITKDGEKLSTYFEFLKLWQIPSNKLKRSLTYLH